MRAVDEYADHVNDSTYTNWVAAQSLRATVEAAAVLDAKCNECMLYKQLAEDLVILFDNDLGSTLFICFFFYFSLSLYCLSPPLPPDSTLPFLLFLNSLSSSTLMSPFLFLHLFSLHS
jgi:hypothetical protein